MRKWSANESRLLAKVEVGSSHSGHAPRTASEGGDMEPLLGIGAMDWASGGDFVACGLSSGDVVIVSPGDMTVLSRQEHHQHLYCHDIFIRVLKTNK